MPEGLAAVGVSIWPHNPRGHMCRHAKPRGETLIPARYSTDLLISFSPWPNWPHSDLETSRHLLTLDHAPAKLNTINAVTSDYYFDLRLFHLMNQLLFFIVFSLTKIQIIKIN